MNEILKLNPAFKDYIWGGETLKTEYGVEHLQIVAEAWVCSCHKDGYSTISNENYLNKSLFEVLSYDWVYESFPFLIKLIDAKSDLSIQVHPSDEYANRVEGQPGKTEMWYILDAKQDAGIYYGFKNELTREEFKNAILQGTLTDTLNFVKVKKGDCFFIEAGTIHAIGKGLIIAEIQQNSNVTYRVFDYNRLGFDKKPRELHVEKALDVTNTKAMKNKLIPESVTFPDGKFSTLVSCNYFSVFKLELNGFYCLKTPSTFTSLLIIEGNGHIFEFGSFSKYDCFFVPKAITEINLSGVCTVLITFA